MRNPFDRSIRIRDGIPVLPGALPVVGHFLALDADPVGLLREGHAALGPVFWANTRLGRWGLFVSGTTAFELLKNKALSSSDYKRSMAHMFGDSMISSDGRAHAHVRSAMSPVFSPRGLVETGVAARTAEMITSRVEAWAARGAIDAHAEARALTLDVIFGIIGAGDEDLPTWAARFRQLFLTAFPLPVDLPGFPLRRGLEARRWLDEHFLAIATAARRAASSEGIAGALVRALDEEGAPLSDYDIVENLRLLALAGHDTTASTMAWMLVCLARHPDVWRSLVDEARARPEVPSSPKDLRSFPVAEALFRETLRLYPAAPFVSRRTTDWITVHHHPIRPKTTVFISLCLLSRDPDIFPEPDRFDPSRWLRRDTPPGPLENASFGGGPHFCLGYHLALMEGVQLGVALALALDRRGLRPRLADGPAPRHRYVPLGRPSPSPRIQFVGPGAPTAA